jgi:hypothetical protein
MPGQILVYQQTMTQYLPVFLISFSSLLHHKMSLNDQATICNKDQMPLKNSVVIDEVLKFAFS